MTEKRETQRRTELSSLAGDTAIVTGAAWGIGRAIAESLHGAGANVVVADPDEERHAVALELNEARAGSAIAVSTDVSDEASVDSMVSHTIEAFGAIDVLVNNAGIYPMSPLLETPLSLLRKVLAVNLEAVFLCTQAVAKSMIATGRRGRIVNITSIDAIHPSMPGLAHYDASKHGVWGFTKSSALELAEHGIRVNAIAPGGIETHGTGDVAGDARAMFEAMIPMGRMGKADEIGSAALFLASDMSSYMTGSQIVVDGGRLLR